MQAVIDARFAVGLLPPRVLCVAHAGAFGLDGEIHQRGGAAESRGARSGFEIVARRRPSERHIQVCVDVDAARHYIHAARVDPPVDTLRGQAAPNILDLFTFDQNVRVVGPLGSDNGSVLNQSCTQHAPPVIWAQVRSGSP